MTRDGERIRALENAARRALDELSDMTTEAFERGADKPLRDELARALGYVSDDAYYAAVYAESSR